MSQSQGAQPQANSLAPVAANSEDTLLSGLRIIELTDESADGCGRLLADMGADVIKIEPPGGAPSRRRSNAEFNDAGVSYDWLAYNVNKRSMTLDIRQEGNADVLRELVSQADCVIESLPVGEMDRLGLGYRALSQVRPSLVMTSITAFGQAGPLVDTPATDLTLVAEGGFLAGCGAADRSPIRIAYPQVRAWTALNAASATLVAITGAASTGHGRHVDVPMLNAVPWFIAGATGAAAGPGTSRHGPYRKFGRGLMRVVFPCADGFVTFSINAGPVAAKAQGALVQWMADDGLCPDWLASFDFAAWDANATSEEFARDFEDALLTFLRTKTRDELFRFALGSGLFLAPMNSIDEVQSRAPFGTDGDLWFDADADDEALRIPGPVVDVQQAPLSLRRSPPSPGEHTSEVLIELLGWDRERADAFQRVGKD